MKQLKPRDKITQKMTRDGAVEVNETQQTAERISSREAINEDKVIAWKKMNADAVALEITDRRN